MKQFLFNNNPYTVATCVFQDIPSHIEKVLSYWTKANVNIDEQQLALEQAVDEQTAWKVIDSNNIIHAVIYCNMLNNRDAISNLLWFENKRMFAILSYFLRLTANIQHIYFLPHTKDFIPFKFIVQDSSIRLFHSHNEPLEIDLYSKKSQKLYETHFLKYGIQEL